ncbi:MAG: signal transduction histidine kinase NtrB [Limisphaerales bacterium]|nr:MAG: signal transduction histidine kinase NtrB [Limisphaerales bacterium]TXT47984.1 MAG: signal transduction histidine kinase NtrB [Limisphaerales bacterium]
MPSAEDSPRFPAQPGAASAPAGRLHSSVLLICVAGVATAAWIFWAITAQEQARAEAEFHRRAAAQHLGVHQSLAKYEHLLASIQKLHDPTPSLMTNQVEASAGLLRSQGMPLFALQWVPRVRHAERAAFEDELRRAGAPDPVIREFTPDRKWIPSPPREEYFPRRFSSPMTNLLTLGANFASEGVHREKMLAARDTGEPTLDSLLGANQLPTFVFILPIFPPTMAADSVEERQANLTGFLLAYVRSADLAVALSQFQRDSGVDMLFSTPAGPGSNEVAHFIPNAERPQTAPPELAAAMRAGLHRELPLRLASLPLKFLYRPAPEWLAAQRTLNRYGALASTLLLTALAAGFVHALHRRREVVEALVNLRTAELRSAVRQLRESENLYQSLVHTLPQLVFRKDCERRFTFVNEHAVKLLGRPIEAILGRTDAELFPPELAAKFQADDERVLATGEPLETEERTSLGPEVTFARVSKTALRDEAGNITGLQGIAWDITERHRFVEALRESEARFRAFTDNLPAPAWLKDHEFRYSFVNPALAQLFQKKAQDVLGREDHDFMPGPAAEPLRANDLAVLAAGEAQQFIEEVPGADGWPRHWLVAKFPFTVPGGQRWVGGIAFDITARVEAITALRQREQQMRLFVEHTPAAVAMLNRELRYLAVSRRWLEDYRLGDADVVGKSHYEVFPEIPERWKEIHRRCLTGVVERCEEDPFPRADGRTDWVRWEIHPWRDTAGHIGGLIMFTEVITERKLARQALERRDAVLHAVARTADELVRAQPSDEAMCHVLAAIGEAAEVSRVYVFKNRVAAGGDLLLSQHFEWTAPGVPARLPDPDLQDASYAQRGVSELAAALARREAVAGHARNLPAPAREILERHGTRSFLAVPIFTGAQWWGVLGFDECRQEREWTGLETDALNVVAGVLGAAFERQRAEQERAGIERKMVESQKLESLGVLAGGIAHDFNNLLTSILGNASLLRFDLPKDSPLHPSLAQIEQTSLRAADLCRQMLAYSGRGRFQLQRVDMAKLVEDTTHLIEVSISKKVVLRFNFAPGVPAVEADPTQLRQIVMNLVINASEAIGDRSGIIAITTGEMQVDKPYLATTYLAPDLPAGRYAFLEISDNGCGMTPEVKARIFDPFFTTKFAGRGLGLAAVLGIVRGHGGALKVYSEPGKGTSFKLLLPAATGAVTSEPSVAASPENWRGLGRVLVVDDEATVRVIATRLLEALGFTVTVAEDGRAGVETFQRQPDAFHLVLMDLTMPHYDGVQAYGLMRRIRADVRVILMSGFNEQDAIANFTGKGLAGFLSKPFDMAALTEKVRAALNANG